MIEREQRRQHQQQQRQIIGLFVCAVQMSLIKLWDDLKAKGELKEARSIGDHPNTNIVKHSIESKQADAIDGNCTISVSVHCNLFPMVGTKLAWVLAEMTHQIT